MGDRQGVQNRLATPMLATLRIASGTESFGLSIRKKSILLCLAEAEIVALAEERVGRDYTECYSARGRSW